MWARKKKEKTYEVAFLASCIDYEAIEEAWKKNYPENLFAALQEAARITLSDQTTPYVEAFVDSLNRHVSKSETLSAGPLNLMQVLDDLEMYIRGKDRVALVKSIKDAKIDIFGTGQKNVGWEKYVGNDHPNITLHPPIPFEEAIEVMQQSKIVLNSCPWIKNGAHERIFAGMASGALVLTSENPYMAENFEKGKDILFYHHGRWGEVNNLINRYLQDDALRRKIAESGRKKVMEHHTWDQRVDTLLNSLPEMLRAIREKTSH